MIQFLNCDIAVGKKTILKNLNFKFNKGQCIYITGRNGSGKSVFLQSIFGFRNLKSGKIVNTFSKENICYVPETAFFVDSESIRDVLDTISLFYKPNPKELSFFLELLKLNENFNTKIDTLSKGTKKKLEILPLFLSHYDLVVLDEIFVGLDADSVITVCNQIQKLHQQDALIFFTEHNTTIFKYIQHLIPNMEVYQCQNKTIIKES